MLVSEASIRDLRVSDCRADLTAFNGSSFQDVVFERCQLMQASFEDALLRGVALIDCDLSGADFRRTRFERCQMRGCTLEGASGLTGLRGVAMAIDDMVANAVAFAAALGVTLLDE